MVLLAIANLLAGIVLFAEHLARVPKVGSHLRKFSETLAGFGVLIGVFAIVLGIADFGIAGAIAILAGILLCLGWLSTMPKVGNKLDAFASWLVPAQDVIGLLAIVAGITGFF